MTKTQCDVCGNTMDHEQSICLLLNQTTESNKIGHELHAIDLCPQCYKKVCKLVGIKERV